MTVDREMLKILQNLENAKNLHEQKVSDRAEGKAVVTEDAQEMYQILKRLEDATTNVAQTIVEQKDTNPMTAVGTMSDNTVSMGDYSVVMEKKSLTEKYKKTFYTIKKGERDIYVDLGLFESAMAILKKLVTDKTGNIKKIIDLDDKYVSYLNEAANHKQRASMINESSRKDVAIAKQSSAMDRASYVKKQIKSLI